MTIEDVEHEEDLRRIRPLKAVVLCHEAVNYYKTRTGEVTICISERLPDRPRRLPHTSIWERVGGDARGASEVKGLLV